MTMSEQTDDPEAAVIRLESALERIARLAGQPHPAYPSPVGSAADEAPVVPAEEIASRLDHLIDRLRAALAGKSG